MIEQIMNILSMVEKVVKKKKGIYNNTKHSENCQRDK